MLTQKTKQGEERGSGLRHDSGRLGTPTCLLPLSLHVLTPLCLDFCEAVSVRSKGLEGILTHGNMRIVAE